MAIVWILSMSWSISMSDTSFIELTKNQVILYFHMRNAFFAVKLCKVQTSVVYFLKMALFQP